MSERVGAPHVGAPDPEKRNSPIVEETAEDFEVVEQELGEAPVCYFNGKNYADKSMVCSGDELLRCERGQWLRLGSCDPDNP
ncbi:hypothetical protein [Thiohalomonas denitrificans]|uniref:DUF1496 domain-containing protein n=1 Tax=Thiohalomonas denitrificans TaxID=415747 RepID=A0A1G5QZ15_9GAMM|nr:hypothetical protein [Thiohalomonas denitrificans]SCZ66329.1 hypothetical protein SAMN03097708_02948 [Thiohalomonas denitrificans]